MTIFVLISTFPNGEEWRRKSGAGTGSVVGCEAVVLLWQIPYITATITEEILASLREYSCSCFETGIANTLEIKYREEADKNVGVF